MDCGQKNGMDINIELRRNINEMAINNSLWNLSNNIYTLCLLWNKILTSNIRTN